MASLKEMLISLSLPFFNMFLAVHTDKVKTAKEEARELLLREESSIREKVRCIQKNLSVMLRALGEMAIANPVFAHLQLPSLVSI